jgi:hypothetical protein
MRDRQICRRLQDIAVWITRKCESDFTQDYLYQPMKYPACSACWPLTEGLMVLDRAAVDDDTQAVDT